MLSPPPPSTSAPFPFTCRCLNVSIEGRVPIEIESLIQAGPSASKQPEIQNVWLEWGETIKHPAYVSYHQDDLSSRRASVAGKSEDGRENSPGPSWRTCWICGVRCYQTKGKARTDPGVEKEWVEVDLNSGIRYGSDLATLVDEASSTFSSLILDLPSGGSSFGRPPPGAAPAIYPSPSQMSSIALLPPIPDPFFLPPPFIPSHPHLRELCDLAVARLRDHHSELENEVKAFLAQKAREMKNIEDKVRAEVEILWEKYRDGPGRFEEERKRSMSINGSTELSRALSKETSQNFPPRGQESASINNASPSLSGVLPSTSLLSASLSARAFHAPKPGPSDVEIEDPVAQITRNAGNQIADKDIAASYMISNLEQQKGSKSRQRSASREGRKKASSAVVDNDGEQSGDADADLHEKDSWIGMERKEARRLMSLGRDQPEMNLVEEEGGEGRTPRPRTVKQLQDDKKDRSKSVKFEEPKVEQEIQAKIAEDDDDMQDDYVFDFDFDEDISQNEDPAGSPSIPPPRKSSISTRTRNMVENNLSTAFAADAPSHRAAWRRIEESGSMYSALKRENSYTRVRGDDDVEEEEDLPGLSKDRGNLAKSMPVNIVMPVNRRRVTENLPEKERKTSLADRTGVLVYPLRQAMRVRPSEGNSLGLDVATDKLVNRRRLSSAAQNIPNRVTLEEDEDDRRRSTRIKGSRSASVSREREQVRGYGADPGAVFETLADGQESDDDEDGDEEDEEAGTLVEGRNFVPPHILAGRSGVDRDGGIEVGWRSLAD